MPDLSSLSSINNNSLMFTRQVRDNRFCTPVLYRNLYCTIHLPILYYSICSPVLFCTNVHCSLGSSSRGCQGTSSTPEESRKHCHNTISRALVWIPMLRSSSSRGMAPGGSLSTSIGEIPGTSVIYINRQLSL